MNLENRKYKRRLRWGILPVVLFLVILCIGTISAADEPYGSGKEIYVNGAGVNGDGSEASPFNNMEDAIEEAEEGSVIWITGTVTVEDGDDKSWSIDPGEKPDVVVMRHKSFIHAMVHMNGGTLEIDHLAFDGNSEEVSAAQPIVCVEEGKFLLGADGILRNNDNSVPDNFVVANRRGGGIYAAPKGEMSIKGKITHNTVGINGGGGIYTEAESQMEMDGAEVCNNTTTGSGGGMLLYGETRIKDTKVNENTAGHAGGIYTGGYAGIYITDGEVCNNTATATYGTELSAGGIFAGSGYLAFKPEYGTHIQGTKINGNRSVRGPGGIAASRTLKMSDSEVSGNEGGGDGGGIYLNVQTGGDSTTFNNVIINDNIGRNGGGVAVYQAGGFMITGGEISGNSAQNGGGVYTTNRSLNLRNIEMDSNTAQYDGGAVYINMTSYYFGTMYNVTFSNNTAAEGYFWTLDPSPAAGSSSYYHNQYITNCTYSQGPVNEDKTIYADYTNAYNNYDISYRPSAGAGTGKSAVDITKTITAGGEEGLIEIEEELTYQLAYEAKNFEGMLSDVYVKDILPDEVELLNCSGSYDLYDKEDNPTAVPGDARIIVWELGNITANNSGTFTVKVKVLAEAGGKVITNKAGIIAEKEYQEEWDEASIEVEVTEIIEFTVPKTFDYGEIEIGPGRRYFGLNWQDSADKETGENVIAVEDTRKSMGADWKLYANLSEDVWDQARSNKLNDVLVYCEEGTETILTGSNTLIADKNKYGAEYNWISEDWYPDYEADGKPSDGKNAKGLYMVLQPGQGSVTGGGSYKGEITWVLAYTP